MTDLNFIRDEGLRDSLESDWAEMTSASDHGLHKSAAVLSGSITEALLVDALISAGVVTTEMKGHDVSVEELSLGQLIGLASKHKLVSSTTKKYADAVGEFRNLLHPGKARRESAKLGPRESQAAVLLAQFVVAEVADARLRTQGMSAEQFLDKLQRDNKAAAIARHLIANMQPGELERLVTTVIPNECADIDATVSQPDYWQYCEPREAEQLGAYRATLARVHRDALNQAKPEVRQAYMRTVLAAVTDGDQSTAEMFLGLCTGSDLKFVENDKRRVLIDRLLGELSGYEVSTFAPLLGALAPYLTPHDPIIRLIRALLFEGYRACAGGDDRRRSSAALSALCLFYAESDERGQQYIRTVLDTAQSRADEDSATELVEYIGFVRQYIMDSVIPF